MGNGVAADALVVSPSSAFGPEKDLPVLRDIFGLPNDCPSTEWLRKHTSPNTVSKMALRVSGSGYINYRDLSPRFFDASIPRASGFQIRDHCAGELSVRPYGSSI